MKIQQFHYLTNDGIEGLTLADQARLAVTYGLPCLQLRMKEGAKGHMKKSAKEVAKICKSAQVQVIVNDHIDIAKAIEADGVHLGQSDMEARKILGKDMIIGATANTFEDIRYLNEAGADYIGLGPFKFTSTKETLNPILGLDGIKTIVKQCLLEAIEIPLIIIGGIQAQDVQYIMDTGVHGIAVSSAINQAGHKGEVIQAFIDNMEKALIHA